MEQELIRFAKVHGYINATIMMCSGVVLTLSIAENGVIGHRFPVPLVIFMWSINPILSVVGCVTEDAGWLKTSKQMYVIASIAGIGFFLSGILNLHSYPLGAMLAIPAASFYGLYVLDFLEKLFNTLKLRRTGIISITTIVCDDPSTAPLPVERPDGSFVVPVIPPPSASRPAVVPESTSAPQTKEFPTWT